MAVGVVGRVERLGGSRCSLGGPPSCAHYPATCSGAPSAHGSIHPRVLANILGLGRALVGLRSDADELARGFDDALLGQDTPVRGAEDPLPHLPCDGPRSTERPKRAVFAK